MEASSIGQLMCFVRINFYDYEDSLIGQSMCLIITNKSHAESIVITSNKDKIIEFLLMQIKHFLWRCYKSTLESGRMIFNKPINMLHQKKKFTIRDEIISFSDVNNTFPWRC